MGEPVILTGRAYLARSSRQIAARLTFDGSRAVLTDDTDEPLLETDAPRVRFDAPVGRAARRLTLPDGTLFETDDLDAADAMAAHQPGHRLHKAEGFSPRLVWVIGAAILGVLGIWKFALPALVWVAVLLTPEPLKRAIDIGTLQAADLLVSETTLNRHQQDFVHTIFNNVVVALPEDHAGRNYTLLFRDAPMLGPNAMALPGGTMVMTDQLVRQFDDPDIIAGVLGHEIGHVAEDHGLTQLYRSLGFYVMVALIAGDTGPILEDVLLEGGVVLSLSYSREHERDADDFGIRLAEAAGYDPAGLITFFESLPDADDTDSGWGSTHPASGERIDAIRDYLRNR